jgi:hypothetical protein
MTVTFIAERTDGYSNGMHKIAFEVIIELIEGSPRDCNTTLQVPFTDFHDFY